MVMVVKDSAASWNATAPLHVHEHANEHAPVLAPVARVKLQEKYNLTIGGVRKPTGTAARTSTSTSTNVKSQGSSNKSPRRQRVSATNLEDLSLHPGIEEQPFYSTYSATATLLLVVHILYVKQILTRKLSRSSLLANYNRLVQRKHYHLALGAILSHAPTKSGTRTSTGTSRSPTRTQNIQRDSDPETSASASARDRTIQHGNGEQTQTQSSSSVLPLVSRLHAAAIPLVGPFGPGRPLSGLPLLFYCAHILWACRAMEVVYGSGWNYARVLWAVTWTGLVMDLGFTFTVLNMLRDTNYFSSAASAPFAMGLTTSTNDTTPPVARQVERVLVQRSIGSLATTTCAVLFVFRDHFDVPIPAIPFLPTIWPLLSNPTISYTLAVGLLLVLSHPIHPVAGVTCGTLAGLFWVSGWTNFLADPYWSNGSIVAYVALCLLAFKANNIVYLPCIDYVSWDSRGEIIEDLPDRQDLSSRASTSRSTTMHLPADDATTLDEPGNIEDIPLYFGQTSRHIERRISGSSLNYLMEDEHDEEGEDSTNRGGAEMTPLIPPSGSVNVGPIMRSRRPPTAAAGSRL